METIKNYLENMFVTLPKTKEMLKLKDDILSNMEEKYHELKAEGKSENEAIGIVISEFGNIDELVEEFGIMKSQDDRRAREVSRSEAYDYINDKKKSGKIIGIGVVLCILAGAALILFDQLFEDGILGNGLPTSAQENLGLVIALLIIVPAIALFINNGSKMEKYKYLLKDFNLSTSLKASIENDLGKFAPRHTSSIIFGVTLCILSPCALFGASLLGDESSSYGVVALLIIVSVAVYIFVYFGNIKESYKVLLKLEDFTKDKKEEDRVIGAVAGVVWPLAVCTFLISGFVYEMWEINWIIFVVTGILFGMFCSVYSTLRKDKN